VIGMKLESQDFSYFSYFSRISQGVRQRNADNICKFILRARNARLVRADRINICAERKKEERRNHLLLVCDKERANGCAALHSVINNRLIILVPRCYTCWEQRRGKKAATVR